MEIKLTFHQDDGSRLYPTGYWMAQACPEAGSADFDGDGLTPLDAVMALAAQMQRYIKERAL